MLGGRIYFTNDKAQTLLFQGRCRFTLERIQIADRRRRFNAAISGHRREVGLSRGCGGLADARAAINLVVEDKDSKILRMEIARVGRL